MCRQRVVLFQKHIPTVGTTNSENANTIMSLNDEQAVAAVGGEFPKAQHLIKALYLIRPKPIILRPKDPLLM